MRLPSLKLHRLASSRSNNKLQPLVIRYHDFLERVKHQGDGDIITNMDGNIGVLTLSNPTKSNSVCGKMMFKLASFIDSILIDENNENLASLIIQGSPKAFCAGADFGLVKNIVNNPEMGSMMCDFMTDLTDRIRREFSVLSFLNQDILLHSLAL